MSDEIYYSMKPIIENYKTIWVPDFHNCGSNKIIKTDNGILICGKCKEEIKKGR